MGLTVQATGWSRPHDVPCTGCGKVGLESTGRERWIDPDPPPNERAVFDIWTVTCPACGVQAKTVDTVDAYIRRHSIQDATLIICHDPGDTIDGVTQAVWGAAGPSASHVSAASSSAPRAPRRRQCFEALEHLGAATAATIAGWVNEQPDRFRPTTPNDVARRLGELAEAGHIARAGTTRNSETGQMATVWKREKA